MLFRTCIYHLLWFPDRSVFVGFRTLIREPGCKQVFLSPVTHIKHQIQRHGMGLTAGGGGLHSKGRYGCVASAKPRLVKIFHKT